MECAVWQHYYKETLVNINPVELMKILAQATDNVTYNQDASLLKRRFGKGCTIEDGERVVTLYVSKGVVEPHATAAAPKSSADQEALVLAQ